MARREKGKKKSVTNEVVTREYTVNIHKRIHGMWVFFHIYILYNFAGVKQWKQEKGICCKIATLCYIHNKVILWPYYMHMHLIFMRWLLCDK